MIAIPARSHPGGAVSASRKTSRFAHRCWPAMVLAAVLSGAITETFAAPPEASSAGIGVEPVPEVGMANLRPAEAGLSLNLHVFGFSYHPDREGTRVSHLDNELNIGLGINYELHQDERGVTSVEAGFLKDSGRNWAKFAGIGYQFKLGERWSLGADALLIHSATYNHNRAFIAPIPRLTYDFGFVKLNATYIPVVNEFNRFAAYGFYFTIPLKAW